MGSTRPSRTGWLVAAVAAVGLAAMAVGPLRDPLRVAEARTILVGREVLAHGLPTCRGGSEAGDLALACATRGSAALAPVAIALAESAGGLRGARLPGVLLAVALVAIAARLAAAPTISGNGPLAAATFVALGLPLPLAVPALTRIYAVALLGGAALLLEAPSPDRARLRHPLAGLLLALAAVTSYATAPLAAALALLAVARRGSWLARLSTLLLFVAVLAAHGLLAVRPAWEALRLGRDVAPAALAGAPRFGRMVDWLSMPLLLASFGLFRKQGPGGALRLAVASALAFAVPLASARAEDQETAALAALVLLAPAAALGVERMGELFAAGGSALLRPAFAAAVLLVVAVFGLHQARTFRREQPDLSGAVALLQAQAGRGATVAADSDFGSPEAVYRYHLERGGAGARVVGLARATDAERRALVESLRPDYVVLDQHHSPRSFARAAAQYQEAGYALAGSWAVTRAPAVELLQVLSRERPAP